MIHRPTVLALSMSFVVPFLLVALSSAETTPPITLSGHPQLFLDDHLVRAMTNLERTIQPPTKHPCNPLIVQDQPWEARLIEIYGTVLNEPAQDLFRCWYLGSEHNGVVPDTPEHPKTAEYFTCYAESSDGIHWTKPLVGPEPYGARTDHNIVIEGTHGFCVLPDPDDPDPNRRYKGIGGPLFGFSPDGIHWETRDWRSAVGKNDTGSCVVRWKDEYLAYVRAQVDDPDWPGVMRGVGLGVSQDFENWTKKETVFTTDKQDGYPWVQPYGISVTPYGDVLIGILWLLHLDQVEGNNSLGDQDTQLVVSRDGRTWQRVADRQVFMQATPGTWDGGRVFPGTTFFTKDDRVHIYYTGMSGRHGEGAGKPGIGLATLPADRFVALQPAESGAPGVLETHPVSFEGTSLIVNAEAAEGDLQVELLDASGNIVPGFSRDQCRLLPADPLRRRVVWQADEALKTLAEAKTNQPLALRFILHAGELYAFQIGGADGNGSIRTARKHVNPMLGPEDDFFFSRQAEVFLAEAEQALAEYPPQYPEPLPRRLALRLLDGVTHEPYAPCRPELQRFHHERIGHAVADMETRAVEEDAYIWKLYNHGFVVRTKSVTLGFDLFRGPTSTDVVDKDGKGARVPCPGFPITDGLAKRLADQCDVLFISHRHQDHADPFIAATMLADGKPVIATEETFRHAPGLVEQLTAMERKAHVVQPLPVKGGGITLDVVVYPGQQYQDGGALCNTVLVTTPEGLTFAHNGDQINDPYPEYQEDFAWIDKVADHFEVDVLMTNCWLNDPMRFVRGFDPKLVIMGHENEMGHDAWDRMPYWGDAEFIRSTYPQLMASDYPVLVMAWGEGVDYPASER